RGVLTEAGGDGRVFTVGDSGRGEGADLHAGRSARRSRNGRRSRGRSLRRRSRRYGRRRGRSLGRRGGRGGRRGRGLDRRSRGRRRGARQDFFRTRGEGRRGVARLAAVAIDADVGFRVYRLGVQRRLDLHALDRGSDGGRRIRRGAHARTIEDHHGHDQQQQDDGADDQGDGWRLGGRSPARVIAAARKRQVVVGRRG